MHTSSMACENKHTSKKTNAAHIIIPTACISPIHSRMHFDANLAVQNRTEEGCLHMCHNAIFPFYGALSTMPPNIWQYYTALHEHHYAAQNPREVHSQPSKAIGSALAARPRRQGGLYCSGPQLTQPGRLNRRTNGAPLLCFFLSLASCFRAPGFCQHKNGTVRTNAKTRT